MKTEEIEQLKSDFLTELKTFEEGIESLKEKYTGKLDALSLENKKVAEFEKGKWYSLMCGVDKWLILFDRKEGDEIYGCAISGGSGRWYNSDYWGTLEGCTDIRLATKEEVQEALVKEAERRGFKEGVRYQNTSGSVYTGSGKLEYGWNGKDNLHFNGGYYGYIYENGKWATILKDEVIKIDRYTVVFEKDSPIEVYTTIDGHTFTKDFWEAAKTVARHSKAKVKIGCSHQFDLPLSTIEAILKRL